MIRPGLWWPLSAIASFQHAADGGFRDFEVFGVSSSVWFCLRYRRVAVRVFFEVSLWSLVFGVSKVMMLVSKFRRLASCVAVSPGLR